MWEMAFLSCRLLFTFVKNIGARIAVTTSKNKIKACGSKYRTFLREDAFCSIAHKFYRSSQNDMGEELKYRWEFYVLLVLL
jgi:hypothetical protein